MYGTVDCCTYIDSSPSLAGLLNRLADAASKDRRALMVTAFIRRHGIDCSLQFLQPNWRKGERSETPLVTLQDDGDTIALDLADDELETTVEAIGLKLGY